MFQAMAIQVFPDSPNTGMSPRISFSHDLSQNDIIPIEQSIRSSNSSIDFDFCVFRESFDQDSSSADELFFDGKILPIGIKKRLPLPLPSPPPPPPQQPQQIHEISKHTNSTAETKNPIPESEEKHNYNKSSFWRFKRSSSLNCGSGYGRSLCPLPLLSRSNSTGSTSNIKRSNNLKQNLLKSSSSTHHQKPPLNKNTFNHASYCNGVKIHPVLNVPPANLFGLGSIFSSGRDKSKKK